MRPIPSIPTLLVLAALWTPAWVPSASAATTAEQAQSLSEGTVKKIDAGKGRITLAHGPIVNLGMPPMTMTFRAENKDVLKGIKPGDQVQFRAEDKQGTLTITQLKLKN